ncbi:MAG: GNAT family N-acetyltransferase [Traorella sp.]
MNIELKKNIQTKQIYDYMHKQPFPYNYEETFDTWEQAYLYDIDSESRTLFSNLVTIGAFLNNQLIGFVQYGKTAIGFDEQGDISNKVSYALIRNLYFDENQNEVGRELLNVAVNDLFDTTDTIYAFFHYFGMSCYARHGKLFERFEHIHHLLKQNGFVIEHENVFYSSILTHSKQQMIDLKWHEKTSGQHQYCDFILNQQIVGGCEIHFLTQENIAYLRWIFINKDICGKGIGSLCMSALKADLYNKGIVKFDTDTALTNKVAQHFYEKNGFKNEGITRSYYLKFNKAI